MNIIIVRPPDEVRIPRRTAARANFVVITLYNVHLYSAFLLMIQSALQSVNT